MGPKLNVYFDRIKFKLLPKVDWCGLHWKDKFDTPRAEICPAFTIRWLWFEICFIKGSIQFWEQWLWLYKYCNGDKEQARDTWPWVDFMTRQSTWNL